MQRFSIGAKPVQGALENYRKSLYRPVPFGRLDKDVSMTLSPELGRGVFSSPGVEGHRDGLDWAPVFVVQQIVEIDTGVRIESVDELAGLSLTTELCLDADDVVKTRHTLTNLRRVFIRLIAANTLPLPARANELMTFLAAGFTSSDCSPAFNAWWLSARKPSRTHVS